MRQNCSVLNIHTFPTFLRTYFSILMRWCGSVILWKTGQISRLTMTTFFFSHCTSGCTCVCFLYSSTAISFDLLWHEHNSSTPCREVIYGLCFCNAFWDLDLSWVTFAQWPSFLFRMEVWTAVSLFCYYTPGSLLLLIDCGAAATLSGLGRVACQVFVLTTLWALDFLRVFVPTPKHKKVNLEHWHIKVSILT